MKTTGTRLLRQVSLLLIVLLCSTLAMTLPVVSQAAPVADATQHLQIEDTDYFSLMASEVDLVQPEAILQLDKALLFPLLQAVWQQLYAALPVSEPIPALDHSFRGDCGLHTILTKGP